MTEPQRPVDFATMSRQKLIDLALAAPNGVFGYATQVNVHTPGEVNGTTLVVVADMVSVTFRADATHIARVDELAGRDREGRSGILRKAVEEFLARHDNDEQAAA